MLGPGHWWPAVLLPLYGLFALPGTRDGARRLGLVTIRPMVDALVRAVESPPPPATIRIVGVLEIKMPG